MASPFTFVTVALNEGDIGSHSRGAGISRDDRHKIRKLAARTADDRHRLATKAKSAATARQRSRQTEPHIQRPHVAPTNPLYAVDEPITPESELSLRSSPSSSAWSEHEKQAQAYTISLPEEDADLFFFDSDASDIIELGVGDEYTPPDEKEPVSLDPLAVVLADRLPQHIRSDFVIDPFWTFNMPFKPFLPKILNYFVTDLCPQLQGIDVQDQNTHKALLAKFIDNPAFIFACAFAASGPVYERQLYNSFQKAVPDSLTPQDLLWIKGSALTMLNAQLRNSNMTPAEIEINIICVLSMAVTENCQGNSQLSELHLKGFERLFNMIGGMKGMSPIMQRYFSWVAQHSEHLFPGDGSDSYTRGFAARAFGLREGLQRIIW